MVEGASICNNRDKMYVMILHKFFIAILLV